LKASLVLLDESGLSERPHRVRTWAPRGRTPVPQFHFNWENLAVIAGMTFFEFYFRLFAGAIRGPQVIEFLRHLGRHLKGPVILVWDRLPAHRSRLVQDYLSRHPRFHQEWLPAYAPEFNPVEYLWGQLKEHQLGNLCAENLAQLRGETRRALRRLQRRRAIVACCWKQAELPF
jgi:transposase